MKLISCHIENFGKLHDYSLTFSNSQHIICEENGWGKSTFAAFLRAMFYGLEGKRKQSIEDNEYKRYTPWQGGVFGGQLTFEVSGKEYTVTRTFGDNEGFELRDAKTNLISFDYSANLGEELFKVDRESFMRTVFIGQSDCRVKVTDDINAKIGNLTDNTNDLDNYETADATLTKILNSLTPRRSTGSLARRVETIARLEREVTMGSSISDSMKQVQEKLRQESESYENLKEQMRRAGEEQKQASAWQTTLAKKGEWERLQATYQNRKEQLDVAKTMFPKEPPRLMDVDDMIEQARQLQDMRLTLRREQMSEEETSRLSALEKQFANEEESVAMMTAGWNERNAKQAALSSKQATLTMAKTSLEMQKQGTKKTPVLTIVGALAVVIGILAVILQYMVPGLVIVAIGLVLVILGVVYSKKMSEEAETYCSPEVEKLQEEINADICFINTMDQKVTDYLKVHGKAFDEAMVFGMLQEITGEYMEYSQLKEKSKRAQASHMQYDVAEQQKRIKEFLQQYAENQYLQSETEERQLYQLRDSVQVYTRAEELYREVAEQIAAFRNETDPAVFETPISSEPVPALDEINEKIMALTEQVENSHNAIVSYSKNLEELQQAYDEWEEKNIRLEELHILQKSEQEKFRRITQAKKFLEKAKESMTARYAAPILNRFNYYYGLITKQATDRFHMDANTSVTVDELGKQRETNTLSAGYRDLIGICLRLALVDAMYTEESPILIMDDPFTNLDDDKVEAGMKFLQQISDKYQIIYLTCSKSRS